MIIGISGRIKAGKGLVSDHLINEYGFEKVTIAGLLKTSLSRLYSLNIDYFYSHSLKNEVIHLPWNKEVAKKYAQILKENYTDFWYPGDEDLVFKNTREAMQFIGTKVLRRLDHDYHVKKMLTDIDHDKNYVCDDVRFPNEKDYIEKKSGKCIYIVRPHNTSFSNHESEISLNWTDFENVIINNEDFGSVKKELILFIKTNKLKPILSSYNNYDYKAFLSLDNTTAYAAGLIAGAGNIVVNKSKIGIGFNHKNKDLLVFLKNYIKTTNLIWSNTLYIDNLLIADNLKLWDITVGKWDFPEILFNKENKHLAIDWVRGLVMSKGIFYSNKVSLMIPRDIGLKILNTVSFSPDVLEIHDQGSGIVQFIFDEMAF